ncbi:MAG: hypothetical protein P8175_11730 [Deltaproteobacteria bacterium]
MIPILIGVAGDAGAFSLGIALVGALLFTGAVLSRLMIYSDQSVETL